MLNKPSKTGISRVLALAVTLLGLLAVLVLATSVAFAQEAPIPYAENGEGPVRTFTSADPEGGGIDWDVTGIDADDFSIDSRGMLTFNSPPNYEGPTDRMWDVDSSGEITAATETESAEGSRDNMYQITVRATEQETSGPDVRALSTETDVTVMVTNVNENGSVTLNRLEPEVGTQIMASLSDPDRDVSMTGTFDHDGDTDTAEISRGWTWYVSKVTDPVADADNHWVVATGGTPTTDVYTPAGKRVEGENVTPDDPNVAVDEGKYLRAVVRYTDVHGAEKTAIGVSMNPVRAEVSSDLDGSENPENGSPGFSSAGDYTRSIPESTGRGMPVGDPVVADEPNDDTLTYELDSDRFLAGATGDNEATPEDDVHYFSIDRATGQIKVAKTLDYDANADGYKFHVRAIDPSGETAEVEVTVTATDANDAPMIMSSVASTGTPPNATFGARSDPPSELRVDEKVGDSYNGMPGMPTRSIPGSMNVFTADDEDARGQIFWDITGEDVDDFELTSSSPEPLTGLRGPGEPIALKFKNDPDFENPTDENRDGVYKVTIVARDRFTGGLTDERSLTIFVNNVHEKGKVTLSTTQPIIGTAVTAAVEDPDNGVAVITWQWRKADTLTGDFDVIAGATTDTYTPVKADDGHFLRATATYIDITSDPDLDTVGIDERTQKDTNNDGVPEAKVPTMGDGSEPDNDKLYRQMMTSANAVRVETPGPGDPDAPAFSAASYDRTVTENAETRSIVGNAVQAVPELDDKGNPETFFTYKLDATISGDDDYFTIDRASGQIRVGEVGFPNPIPAGIEELPDGTTAPTNLDPTLDYESGDTFTLIVTATDNENPSRKAITTVNISLTDLNERPYFDKVSRATTVPVVYSEHRTNAVAQLAGVEPDGDDLRWEVTGPDASDFMIIDADDINDGKDRVQLVFKSQPDFERPKDAAGDTDRNGEITGTNEAANDNYYHVTVRATEMSVAVGSGPALAAELKVTVQVINSNDPGTVDMTLLQPEVGTELTASVSDLDGEISADPGWTWYRAKVRNPNRNVGTTVEALDAEWERIAVDGNEVSTPAYTPQGVNNEAVPPTDSAVDEGWHLLARVVYEDPHGADKEAVGISAYPVRANVSNTDNNSPDFNQSETTREIPEDTSVGMPVGDAVDVDRNEDNDVLTYEIVIVSTGDNSNAAVVASDHSYFSIDKATGQLKVAKKLSAEETDGRTYFDEEDPPGRLLTAGEYTIVVRATDPSGEGNDENRDDIVVKITAKNVDEAPGVTDGMAELSVNEVNSTAKDDDVTKYVGLGYELTPGVDIDDPATVGLAAGNPNLYHRTEEDILDRAFWPEPLAGPDGHLFEYSTPDNGIGRRIHFIDPPSYEDPQDANRDNVYEVTIRVVDGDGLSGEKSVRVTVTNVDETGTLTLSPEQPDAGSPVEATVSDPDSPDGVIVTNWKWAKSPTTVESFGDAMLVPEATMYKYMGVQGDFLWAMVEYRDGASVEDDPVTVLDERNDNPATTTDTEQHKLQDRNEDGELDTNDTLSHNSDEMLAKETDNAVQKAPPTPPSPGDPPAEVIMIETSVKENVPSTGYVGVPLDDLLKEIDKDLTLAPRNTIGGPDGATFVFAEENDNLADPVSTFYDEPLRGPADDAGTEVDEENDKGGQLALAVVTQLDYDFGKRTYTIEVTNPLAETAISTVRVTITVMDVNEAPSAPSELKGLPPALNVAPEFAAETMGRSVAENTAAGENIGAAVTATDADDDTLTYTLGGADAGSFDIDAGTGQLMTSAALDFETTPSYTVTVTASDGTDEAMVAVTITVTDVDEDTALVRYDADNDGSISRPELLTAIRHLLFPTPADPVVTRAEVLELIGIHLFG